MDFIKTFIQAYNMLFLSLVLFYALECFVCICVYVYHVPAWGLQRSEDPDLQELEFQTVTRHPIGMGSRTRSSGRATLLSTAEPLLQPHVNRSTPKDPL